MLPPRRHKKQNRSDRWKSQTHCTFLRKFACSACHSESGIEVSHIRIGTDGGLGRKPSDYYAIPLCKDYHTALHTDGEATFYRTAKIDAHALAEAFCNASPKRAEIVANKRDRGL